MRNTFIALALVLFFLPGGIFAYQVEGTIENGTRERPMEGHPVALKQYNGQQEAVIALDTTDSRGRFQFSGLDSLGQYRLSVYYQTVKYEDIAWSKSILGDHPLKVTVWDTTQSDSNIRVAMQHAVLTEGEGTLFVRQIMRVENTGNKTFKGTVPIAENTYKTLEFSLPRGATNIRPGKGFMQCCVGTNGSEFYDTMELHPGTKDLVIHYEIPVEDEQFVFQDKAPYPVDSYVALIKRQKAKVNSDMLNVLETAADQSFVQLATNQVKEGTVIPIRFSNFLQPPKDYGRYFLALFIALIVGGIVIAKRGKNKTENEEKTMPRDPVCKMPVPEDDTSYTTSYQGDTYYFCCEHCQESFQEHPDEYLANSE
mgnify:CR=1 FL=1